ncbi:MAG: hypothetical protein O3C10_13780, partial [Chloroflexi bacterium]|nr:hypothetical protein [Chloroflexota bacterium]
MRDVERILAGFESGTLLRPSVEIPNSVDLSRAISRLCGDSADAPENGSADEIARLIGPSEHLVFAVADGLGMSVLETLDEDSFLRRSLVRELWAVFPSTTS